MVVCARQPPHFRLMALLPAQYKAHESPEPRNGDHPGRVRSGAQTLDGSPVPVQYGEPSKPQPSIALSDGHIATDLSCGDLELIVTNRAAANDCSKEWLND